MQRLISIMEANNLPETADVLNALVSISDMERRLGIAVGEIQTMRKELAAIREESHPIKTMLQKAVDNMQAQAQKLGDKLDALKQDIVTGCKAALAAFEEKGLAALRDVVGIIKLRPGLESIRRDLDRYIKMDTATLAKIEAVSAEYHKAGRAVKNIARAVAGKEAIQEAKPIGKVARALMAPTRADLACQKMMRKGVDTAINAVKRLEDMKRKEPVMDTLDRLDRQTNEARRNTPERVRQRAEPAHADR